MVARRRRAAIGTDPPPVVRAITVQDHCRVTLLMAPLGNLRNVGDGRCSRSRAASQGVSHRAATLLAGHHRHWSETSADVASPGRLGAQVAGAVRGPHEPPQDGTVRSRRMLRSRLPRDVLGHHVGLLRGQAALFVGAGGRVADREHVVVIGHPEGVVDGDEAVRVARDTRGVRPGEEREVHDPVARQPGAGRELHDRRMGHGRARRPRAARCRPSAAQHASTRRPERRRRSTARARASRASALPAWRAPPP